MSPLQMAAAILSSTAVAGVMWLLIPPTPRLGRRVRPYLHPAGPAVGRQAQPVPVRVFGPMLARVAAVVARTVDPSAESTLALRLRQSGMFPELGDEGRVSAYRIRQLRTLAFSMATAAALAAVLGLAAQALLALVVIGGVAGYGRTRGALERAIERRVILMRIEIYTVDQVLALRVRAGGGVIQAVTDVVRRGRGEVVRELGEAIRLHKAGMSVGEAFKRVAESSPEPACARTYRLLAVADERGVDLAEGLLALAEDARETRREAMKRAATKRRAAMLVPTIALLAPTLLLFVAAPLPYLLTGWR